jgi:hypothetical protein
MASTLIGVKAVTFTPDGGSKRTIGGVSEALYEERLVLDDREVRGGNILPAVADVRRTVAPTVTLLADDADSFLLDGIVIGTPGVLEITVAVARDSGTPAATEGVITLEGMVPRATQQVRLPGGQVPRIQVGRPFTPTQETLAEGGITKSKS